MREDTHFILSIYVFISNMQMKKRKINNGFFTIYKQQRKTWQPSLS